MHLFDPAGRTKEAFEQLRIPYSQVDKIPQLDNLDSGLLIVGEGVDLGRYRGISTHITNLALRGINLLCLAVDRGRFANFPDPVSHMPVQDELMFRSASVIKSFGPPWNDKRYHMETLDIYSSLLVSKNRLGMALVMEKGTQGWPWVEIRYAKPQARHLFVGFSLISQWEHSPVPRFLLKEILASFSN